MTGRYLATALGGALRAEFSGVEVAELWDATDADLREEVDGQIVLWARGVDHAGRLAPLYFRPIEDEQPA